MVNFIFRYFENIINPLPEFASKSFSSKPTIWYFVRKIKWLVFIIAIAGLFKSFIDVSTIYIVGLIIDILNKSVGSRFQFLSLNQLLIIAAIILVIIRPLTSFFIGILCDQSIRAKFSPMVRWELYIRTVNNDVEWFNRAHSGKISSAVWQSGQAVTEFLLSMLQIVWANVAYIFLVIAFMSSLNLLFSYVIVLWIIVYIFLSLKYAPEIKKRSRKSADASNVVNGHLVDIFSNIVNVKSLSPNGNEDEFISKHFNDFINKSVYFLRAITVAETLQIITSSIAIIIVGYISIISWGRGELSVGEISVIFGLVFRLESLLATLMNQLTGAMRSIGLFYSSIDTLHNNNKVSDPVNIDYLEKVNGDIVFNDVCFEYESGKPVIQNINLHIQKGEKLAIVGESGSGKSTLLSLLLRFYDPTTGTIYFDGNDIKMMKQAGLRSHFSIVTQNNILFNRSIYENIIFGCQGPNFDNVINAAIQAKAIDFINDSSDGIKNGFDTLVGDRGVKLSGGQRQRLGICRAILRNTQVLILDEATSSLDSITESDIQASLDNIMTGKTVIAVAHRLSTIINMDRIIVLNKGRIVEEGNHETLVSKKGLYYKLWKQQANL
ncbi:ABC transporter ATP-binding protein [Salmonella enterica]|nr:ABC transporter ATP-binding protein [Salmonella enterica]EJE2439746.1 ABC transporter ATP-binding protein [Salmonella enterica]ELR7680971.1 ABC transporter ATP-binding protein [Salmonella enterica]ELR7741278.1 ABC transporter ATP-binding protein [Salmonella enterica]